MSESSPSYAGLSVVIGVVSLAVGGGYWYWEYSNKKEKERRREARRAAREQATLSNLVTAQPPPALASSALWPDAQAIAVTPPTLATIKQAQHLLNLIAGKHEGEPGYLKEDGSAGNLTIAAIKAFQGSNGMTQTGKFDGMTQSLLKQKASGTTSDSLRVFVRLFWQPLQVPAALAQRPGVLGKPQGYWAVEDSLHFVTEVPGYTEHTSPPSEHVVTDLLIKHYGAMSTVSKAIRDRRYDWSCPDCQIAASSRVSGWDSYNPDSVY